MESIAIAFSNTLGQFVSAKVLIFIISLFPILECRGGLIVASILQVPITQAIPLCVIGNILPIPFILLFLKKIFKFLKRFNWSRRIVEKLESRAENKKDGLKKGEFLGIFLFVGIPVPGTGAWTGSLVATVLNVDLKKASVAILLGIFMATVIISTLFYGLFSFIG